MKQTIRTRGQLQIRNSCRIRKVFRQFQQQPLFNLKPNFFSNLPIFFLESPEWPQEMIDWNAYIFVIYFAAEGGVVGDDFSWKAFCFFDAWDEAVWVITLWHISIIKIKIIRSLTRISMLILICGVLQV